MGGGEAVRVPSEQGHLHACTPARTPPPPQSESETLSIKLAKGCASDLVH